MKNICIIVTSYKRPNCKSANWLSTHTNLDWYILLDNTDDTIIEYEKLYGSSRVIVFDKLAFIQKTDTFTRDKLPTSVVYARNAAEMIAAAMGYKYVLIMDDDINGFRFKYLSGNKLKSATITTEFDELISQYVEFMDGSDLLICLSMLFSNKFLEGVKVFESNYIERSRIGSQIFLRKTSALVDWCAMIYEDITSCILWNKIGNIVLSLPFVTFASDPLYKTSGDNGMNMLYLQTNEVYRAMFTIVANPNCCKIMLKNDRFIPSCSKEFAYPKIISSKFKKEESHGKIV